MSKLSYLIGQIVPSSNTTMESEVPGLLDIYQGLSLSGIDALVASACVQMPSLPAIELIERKSGIPTVSAAICTTYQMLSRLGLNAHVPGAGALLTPQFGRAHA